MAHMQAQSFDQHDPHATHAGEHHGHVIVSPFVLLNVLLALVFFTILTVFFSRAEIWISETFNVVVPHWANVVVALSIAVVKSTLVCLFFMQLKYDNPLNSLIFLFCLFAVSLFLGFSMLDLGTQGLLYKYEGHLIKPGGTQLGIKASQSDLISRNGMPITEWAKQEWKATWAVEHGFADQDGHPTPTGLARAEEAWVIARDEHHPSHHHEHLGSDADQSRPRRGMTPGLYDEHASAHGAEGEHEAEATHESGH